MVICDWLPGTGCLAGPQHRRVLGRHPSGQTCAHAGERMRDAGGVMLRTVTATDYHTAGEPFRIVADPPVALPGVSVADRRVRAIDSPDAQGLRELLCFEPRGHADMYGGFLVPP